MFLFLGTIALIPVSFLIDTDAIKGLFSVIRLFLLMMTIFCVACVAQDLSTPTIIPPTATIAFTPLPTRTAFPTQQSDQNDNSQSNQQAGSSQNQQIAANTSNNQSSGGCVNDSDFVADLTVPDGTSVPHATAFTKTWRLKNSGSCTWNNQYTMVRLSGDMWAVSDYAYPEIPVVRPGETVDLSVPLVLPPGFAYAYGSRVRGIFQLKAPDGELFGTKPYAEVTVVKPNEIPSGGYTTAVIDYFSTTMTSIDASRLLNGSASVPLAWQISLRPEGAAILFEQVFPNGVTTNIETPRENPYVASHGIGSVVPIYPSEGIDTVVIQMRVLMLDTNSLLAYARVSIPVTGKKDDEIVCITTPCTLMNISHFSVSPEQASMDTNVGMNWNIERAKTVNLYTDKKTYTDLPHNGGINAIVRDIASGHRSEITLEAIDVDSNRITRSFFLQVATEMKINSFKVARQDNGKVRLSWDVKAADSLQISYTVPASGKLETIAVTGANGSITDDYPANDYFLDVIDKNGVKLREGTTIQS